MTEMPCGALFGLLFMTMGPIRAIAVFAKAGDSGGAPGARARRPRRFRDGRRSWASSRSASG